VQGIVYLIESTRDYETVYKIGFTRKSSKKRSKQLQTGNDGELKVICEHQTFHGLAVEKTIQNLFSHCKIKNEWFRLNIDDVVKFPDICKKIEYNFDLIKNGDI